MTLDLARDSGKNNLEVDLLTTNAAEYLMPHSNQLYIPLTGTAVLVAVSLIRRTQ